MEPVKKTVGIALVTKLAAEGHCKGYCTGCFSGEYPAPIPENTEKNKFERKLSESEDAE